MSIVIPIYYKFADVKTKFCQNHRIIIFVNRISHLVGVLSNGATCLLKRINIKHIFIDKRLNVKSEKSNVQLSALRKRKRIKNSIML